MLIIYGVAFIPFPRRERWLWCYIKHVQSRWRHQMETFFCVTGRLCGEFTGHRWIPTQRPMRRSFDVFFDLWLNKRSSKHSWGWWCETPWRSLWRQFNDICPQIWRMETCLLFTGLKKDRHSGHRHSHYEDETVVQSSYLYNGNIHTVNTASIYFY